MGYVLDSFAVLAWMKNSEPSASVVDQILRSGDDLLRSAINVGEVVYILRKRFAADRADLFLRLLPNLPFNIVTPNLPDIFEASVYKARYAISYADAFAVQLALKKGYRLVTGDPEFKGVDGLQFVWLEPDGS